MPTPVILPPHLSDKEKREYWAALPPVRGADKERIAREAGLLDRYPMGIGLTTFRDEELLPSGQIIVKEGYFEKRELPTGEVLVIRRYTNVNVDREWATQNK